MVRTHYLFLLFLLILPGHRAIAHELAAPLSVIQEVHYNNQHYQVLSDNTGWRFMLEEPLGNRLNLYFSTGTPRIMSISPDTTDIAYELITYDAGEAGTSTIVTVIGKIRRHKTTGRLSDVSED